MEENILPILSVHPVQELLIHLHLLWVELSLLLLNVLQKNAVQLTSLTARVLCPNYGLRCVGLDIEDIALARHLLAF
jgi:hypothetical protein